MKTENVLLKQPDGTEMLVTVETDHAVFLRFMRPEFGHVFTWNTGIEIHKCRECMHIEFTFLGLGFSIAVVTFRKILGAAVEK